MWPNWKVSTKIFREYERQFTTGWVRKNKAGIIGPAIIYENAWVIVKIQNERLIVRPDYSKQG